MMPPEMVSEEMIAERGSSLGIAGWSDPSLVVRDYDEIELEKKKRETLETSSC